MRVAFATGLMVVATVLAGPAFAQKRGGVEARDWAVVATGLEPAFPAVFTCPPIASPFGSPTRYDGSSRRGDRNGGLHGGLDISLPEGTHLLAAAAGEVVAVGEGGRLEGIFLWLRHAPADTGRSFWTFSKYQHLSALPALKPGERVTVGQVVARSGATGTAGGHYGMSGYPHLHWTTTYGPSGEYELRGEFASMVRAEGAVLDDPLLLFAPEPRPGSGQTVPIGAVGPDGKPFPPGTALVWPVACALR